MNSISHELTRLHSGIPGFDELTADESGLGGIPENTATLIYGPPKTGKSIFSYQYMLYGLINDEPCLSVITDYTLKELQQNTMNFNMFLQQYAQKEILYTIDALTALSGAKVEETSTYKLSSLNNPTDLMVKVGIGTRFIFSKSQHFRSILDSLTTPFTFNPDKLVIRVLKAYIKRVKEAGGTPIILYTEDVASAETEEVLKEVVDNLVRLDGKYVTIESIMGKNGEKMPYKITTNGIVIG